jgi:VCBS repeat-containing protein
MGVAVTTFGDGFNMLALTRSPRQLAFSTTGPGLLSSSSTSVEWIAGNYHVQLTGSGIDPISWQHPFAFSGTITDITIKDSSGNTLLNASGLSVPGISFDNGDSFTTRYGIQWLVAFGSTAINPLGDPQTITGTDGADTLVIGNNATAALKAGDDHLHLRYGISEVDGGVGFDTVGIPWYHVNPDPNFTLNSTIVHNADGTVTVDYFESTVTLRNVEAIQFIDDFVDLSQPQPLVSITADDLAGVTEGNSTTFTVRLNAAVISGSLTVDVYPSFGDPNATTHGGLTYNNSQYLTDWEIQPSSVTGLFQVGPLHYQLTFNAGDPLEKKIVVNTTPDPFIEANEENFTLNIGVDPNTGFTVDPASSFASSKVLNDDGPFTPTPQVSSSSPFPDPIAQYLKDDIQAASDRLSAIIPGFPSLTIEVVGADLDGNDVASGGPGKILLDNGPFLGFPLVAIPKGLLKFNGGTDPNPTIPDIRLTVDIPRLLSTYSGGRDESTGGNTVDMPSILAHEILHGLGVGLVSPYKPLGMTLWDTFLSGVPVPDGFGVSFSGPLSGTVALSGIGEHLFNDKDLMYEAYLGHPTNASTIHSLLIQDLLQKASAASFSKGSLSDGYISGATVFVDINNNGALDAGEMASLSDGSGLFDRVGGGGPIVALGGTDIATGLPFTGRLAAPEGSFVITPLTTLVQALFARGIAAPNEKVLTAFGLDPTIDLTTFIPIAAAGGGDPNGQAAFFAGTIVLDTLTTVASVLAGNDPAQYAGAFDAALNAMADLVIAQGTDLDLNNESQIKALLNNALAIGSFTLDATVIDGVATIVAALNAAAEAAGGGTGVALVAALSSIALVAQGAASDALKDVGDGSLEVATALDTFTGANLSNAIKEAKSQTGDVDGPAVQNASQAIADTYATNEDTPFTIGASGVLENDIDFDGDLLTAILVSDVTHGTLAFNDDGSFIYTPDANYSGSDSFTYKANDGNLDSTAATVTITIDAVNDSAVITGAKTGSVTEDSQLTATGQLTVVDPDTGEASFQAATIAGAYGSLVLSAEGAWTYTLDNTNLSVQALTSTQTLPDTLQVLSADGTTASINITINGADDLSANVVTGTGRGEMLRGTSADDIITPFAGRDIVNARSGDDIIKATLNDGSDFYYGDGGSDTIDYSTLTQRVEVKLGTLFGIGTGMATGRQNGVDVLGSIENVVGSQADDKIKGNSLANVLEGGAGNDRMEGGGGSDSFVFKPDFGKDRITNFDVNPAGGQDFLDISAFGITNADFRERVAIADVGADTLATIDGDPNQTIRLVGIGNASTVSVDDFLLL